MTKCAMSWKIGAKELESALAEGDKHGVGPAIRAIWKNDLQNIKKEFDQDQKQNSEFTQSLPLSCTQCHAQIYPLLY